MLGKQSRLKNALLIKMILCKRIFSAEIMNDWMLTSQHRREINTILLLMRKEGKAKEAK